jgi:hypothetical protein
MYGQLEVLNKILLLRGPPVSLSAPLPRRTTVTSPCAARARPYYTMHATRDTLLEPTPPPSAIWTKLPSSSPFSPPAGAPYASVSSPSHG